jgi:hypothetical protein
LKIDKSLKGIERLIKDERLIAAAKRSEILNDAIVHQEICQSDSVSFAPRLSHADICEQVN